MDSVNRITIDPNVMGGTPCIRGMSVTVKSILGMISSGATPDVIISVYPYLDYEDISSAISYAAKGSLNPESDTESPVHKPRPNHQRRLQILRSMTPKQKLAQVFQLNERTLKLFRIGLRRRFPDVSDAGIEKLYLQMRERCHNRNY